MGRDARSGVSITMLLGPAGSGKTFRCLSEIRNELARSPEGKPLIFLAPKQATFQLERQLLEDASFAGYSRLRILSFQRLAFHIFDVCGVPLPKLLGAEGRVMVLRALLTALHSRFSIFRTSARRLGFADEAGDQIREFQQHGLNPETLRQIAASSSAGPTRDKLLDLALLFDEYSRWLERNALLDEDCLLAMAGELLAKNRGRISPSGVWFDGFAQLTLQERNLLTALLRETDRALLAFCLGEPSTDRFSPWQMVTRTCEVCRAEIETIFGKEAIRIEALKPQPAKSRFAEAPALAHLERAWSSGLPFEGETNDIQLIECADAEGEVVACARAIVRFVRAGGRYREAAVLLRHFENDFPHLVRRVFSRYGIPFFLDHRQRVAHHPLAELTRGALRMVAFNWKHQDCFCVFKSGLLSIRTDALDQLENLALEYGWEGAAWRDGFRYAKDLRREKEINEHRKKLIEPFVRLGESLSGLPSGMDLAEALRKLWQDCRAEEQLEAWSLEAGEGVHTTVWDQMTAWVQNFELAFGAHCMPLRDWLSIVEAGLSGLTVGVVPPVLDQVLVGTVDRSRNPDLKAMFVLGLNEGVFPAIPPHRPLLTEHDRTRLLDHGIELANLPEQQISLEQFYGYIACTRARQKLVLSWSETTSDGAALNPSRFVGQIRRIFPQLGTVSAGRLTSLADVEHASELNAVGAASHLSDALRPASILTVPATEESLDPAVALQLYGRELKVSVVAMERYASCPFRFFVEQGLKVHEREEFSLDVREQGNFQHLVLAKYHETLQSQGRRWRDLTPGQARVLAGQIADREMDAFHDGLLAANEQNKFTGENYKIALQDFIELVTEWFASNEFDPQAVELPFGQADGDLPGWRIEIPGAGVLVLGGRVDRIDVARLADGNALCAVFDYKSGGNKPDAVLMHHGVQQQLPAYLLALGRVPGAAEKLGAVELIPAGCFYVPLGARHESEKTRDEVLRDVDDARKRAHQHQGIFSHEFIEWFDKQSGNEGSAQFKYALKKNGQPKKSAFNALPPEKFVEVLGRLEANLSRFGREIFQGRVAIHPHKKSGKTGCDQCKHLSICRFDSWVQEFNVLRKPPEGGEGGA